MEGGKKRKGERRRDTLTHSLTHKQITMYTQKKGREKRKILRKREERKKHEQKQTMGQKIYKKNGENCDEQINRRGRKRDTREKE